MKKLMLIAALMVTGSFQAAAQTNDPVGYHRLLVEEDVVRAFWSPCAYQDLGQVEREEIAMYESQGFVLIAKILMPQLNPKARIPECQYTFVRKSALK